MKKTLLIVHCLLLAILANAQTSSFSWARQMGGTAETDGNAVALDANGNIYTTGSFSGTVDFDPGSGTANLSSIGFSTDIFISKFDASGNFVWVKALAGPGSEMGYGIKIDASGNIYTTGWFTQTVDFDPGPNTNSFTAQPSGSYYTSYVSKLDASGNFVWAKQYNGGGVYSQGLTLDASGNVYVTGMFTGTTDFDPGAGTVNLSSAVSNPAGAGDAFLSKLDAAGNFVYVRQISGISVDWAFGIFIDATGKIYLTGKFIGTVDFDPGSGTADLVGKGYYDVFILKLDASGNFTWAKSIGGSMAIGYGLAIAADNLGNVYTTGYFTGTQDFDPGSGTFNLVSDGMQDIFVSKLDASGNFAWAKKLGGTTDDAGNSITVDAYRNVYVTGIFSGSGDFDPGSGTTTLTSAGISDVFIARFNESGTMIWAKSFGGTGEDIATGIAVNTAGDVYTLGTFVGAVDFDPSGAVSTLTAFGYNDAFVHKMNQNTIGIKQEGFTNDLQIYPNPSGGIFNVILTNHTDNAFIEVYNSLGVLVCRQSATASNTIDISNEATGLYIVKLTDGNSTITSQKIMKQ